MDYKLPQASKRSNTLDTEEHSGLTWQTGIAMNRLKTSVGSFVRLSTKIAATSQVLQPSVDQSAGSVATEVATSVGSSMIYMMSPSAIKTENQDLAPLNASKRVADSSNLPRKQHRHSSSASQIQGRSQLAAQEMYRRRPFSHITISRNLISDTIQYLQTLSDRILIADTISSTEWVTMHLATQLLQSRYEDILGMEEMETNDVSEFNFPPAQPEERCRKCAAADEERLYD
ncbi:uncharacterized protein N7506_001811 [Penicillium brevicompactum]|uniref:uncharacterized protein n=1 Tax=Penicillium brevicompactum TaxID=5074 RepID=UPI00253FBCEA|nr:uncharacterized protein N7506_001811 [Penicillium brevicompactum]KAJ5348558.1 hypothetical protein N7506_001811 [Penicillium brevicompactum]